MIRVVWLTCLIATFAPAQAQITWLWTAPGGGGFAVPTNWRDQATQTLTGVPGAGDTALHSGLVLPYTVASTAPLQVARVAIASSPGGIADRATYHLGGQTLLASGGPASSVFGIDVNNASGDGSLTLVAGEFRANAFQVASQSAGATSRLTVGGGASLVSGAVATPLADRVGGAGMGSELEIVSGGSVDTRNLFVAAEESEGGAITLSGAASRLQALNPEADVPAEAWGVSIGRDGEGEVQVSGGASLDAQWLSIGGDLEATTTAGQGLLRVDQAAVEVAAVLDIETGQRSSFRIGTSGAGRVELMNQASLTTTARIEAGGAALGGPGGTAEIVVEGGSTLATREVRLGRDVGGYASAELLGPGSTWTDHYGIQIGYAGAGSLAIRGGAQVAVVPDKIVENTGYVNLGRIGAASSGELLVEGAGSLLTAHAFGPSLNVGYEGQGVLTVRDGAVVETLYDVAIGRLVSATGTATVTDPGSILRAATSLGVGGWVGGTIDSGARASGQASLTITDGGSIETPHLRVYAGDSVSLAGGGFGTIGPQGAAVATPNTLTVVAGGILSGEGRIEGHVLLAGGQVAPRRVGPITQSDLPARLTIDGDLTIAEGTLRMKIAEAGSPGVDYDSLDVSGDVQIAGDLAIVLSPGYTPDGSDQFDVVSGSASISGAFESIWPLVIVPATTSEGPIVWGDYREGESGESRYYLAPRRAADFNGVGGVDGGDFTTLIDHFGLSPATFGEGDANGDRVVDGADFTIWADAFGDSSLGAATALTPEPSSVWLAAASLALAAARRFKRRRPPPEYQARPAQSPRFS